MVGWHCDRRRMGPVTTCFFAISKTSNSTEFLSKCLLKTRGNLLANKTCWFVRHPVISIIKEHIQSIHLHVIRFVCLFLKLSVSRVHNQNYLSYYLGNEYRMCRKATPACHSCYVILQATEWNVILIYFWSVVCCRIMCTALWVINWN